MLILKAEDNSTTKSNAVCYEQWPKMEGQFATGDNYKATYYIFLKTQIVKRKSAKI